MKIYLASRYSRREELCGYREQLRAAGHDVDVRWLSGNHTIDSVADGDSGSARADTVAKRQQFAVEDLQDIRNSDLLIAFTEPERTGPTRGGRHVELGYALGDGKPVIICGPRENIFCWLPGVCQFDNFADALQYLQTL